MFVSFTKLGVLANFIPTSYRIEFKNADEYRALSYWPHTAETRPFPPSSGRHSVASLHQVVTNFTTDSPFHSFSYATVSKNFILNNI
jgi:hypothetical protein